MRGWPLSSWLSRCCGWPLSGCMGFQNWRMAPCPDLKGFPRPKMSLELALAMLRLAPSLVLWDFKTDGWPPVPIPKASPNVVGAGFSHAAAGPLSGFMKFQNWRMASCPDLKGFPRPKMSLELALAMLRLVLWDFKTDGWPPAPISKGFPRPKMSLELALAMLRLAPSLVLWGFKTDGWPPVPISKASPGPKCRWSWL